MHYDLTLTPFLNWIWFRTDCVNLMWPLLMLRNRDSYEKEKEKVHTSVICQIRVKCQLSKAWPQKRSNVLFFGSDKILTKMCVNNGYINEFNFGWIFPTIPGFIHLFILLLVNYLSIWEFDSFFAGDSISMVTGPSFWIWTCIIAPNFPSECTNQPMRNQDLFPINSIYLWIEKFTLNFLGRILLLQLV